MKIYLVGTIIAGAALITGLIVLFHRRGTRSPKVQRPTFFDDQTGPIASENPASDHHSVEAPEKIVGPADEQASIPEEMADVLDTPQPTDIEPEAGQGEVAVPDLSDHLLTGTAGSTELQDIVTATKEGTVAVDVPQPFSSRAAATTEVLNDEKVERVETQGIHPASNVLHELVQGSCQPNGREEEGSTAHNEVTPRSVRDEKQSPDNGFYLTAPCGICSAVTAEVSIVSNPAAEPDVQAAGAQTNPTTRPTASPPTYHPPVPPSGTARTTAPREKRAPKTSAAGGDLKLRLQLVFGRDGTVKMLALIPEKCEGMPAEIHVVDTGADVRLVQLRDDSYEPVPLVNAGDVLRRGVAWSGSGAARDWRWTMSGREIYVLAPGDESGFHGFVSIPRLRLNDHQLVLCTVELRDSVFAALENAGCTGVAMSEGNSGAVPSGWVLYRDVMPTKGVAMIEEQRILNVLCPTHDAEIHFVSGIRLERNKWLDGFPPRIRITGALYDDFKVLIDGQPALRGADDTYETPEWDAVGEHQVLFGDRTASYSLCQMLETWGYWPAHDFGTGAAMCGAALHCFDAVKSYSVRIPVRNPLILGRQPGEVFFSRVRNVVGCDTTIAVVPFEPVWALPADALHVDKRAARIVLLNPVAPTLSADYLRLKGYPVSSLLRWITAVNDARRKQLAVDPRTDEALDLWRQYRTLAKQMWRRMR